MSCFVPRCRGRNGSGGQIRLFRPPSKGGDEWVEIMKLLRNDVVFDLNRDSHRLCSAHFAEECIQKVDTFLVEGKTVSLGRDRWRLRPGSVPTIFSNLPKSVLAKVQRHLKKLVATTTSVQVEQPPPPVVPEEKPPQTSEIRIRVRVEGIFETEDDGDGSCCSTLPEFIQRSDVITWWEKNKDHYNWILDSNRAQFLCLLQMRYDEEQPILEKSITISFDFAEPEIVAFVGGYKVDLSAIQFSKHSTDFMSQLIQEIEATRACLGLSGYSAVTTGEFKEAVKRGDKWYSDKCEGLGGSIVCLPCKLLHPKLIRRKQALNQSQSQKGRW